MSIAQQKSAFAFLAVLFSVSSPAQEICRTDRPIDTPVGGLTITHCHKKDLSPTRDFVSIGTVKLLEQKFIATEEFDKPRARWIFSGDSMWETGCPDRLYLVDLSREPVKIIAFGVKKACNEFHWASWGSKRSVIALKKNVKFTYENGKMALPAKGEKLWNAIEPPHAGPGLSEGDAIPFAEDVPLPK